MTASPDRLWPFWLERQADPESPDFLPRALTGGVAGDAPTNVTHRSWTLVGTLDGSDRASVDPRGLVTPDGRGWSLDWWIGADDRWHLPSREAAVCQRLVGNAPVVETAMRIPGGEAIHRAFGVRGPAGTPVTDLIAIEIENRSPVPFAVALAVRPYGPVATGRIGSIDLDATTLSIDGEPAVFLVRAPARFATSVGAETDVVHLVTEGLAREGGAFTVTCDRGEASAALVYPLAHTATLRVAVPSGAERPRRSRRQRGAPVAGTVLSPANLASADHVASGWDAQVARGTRIVLPDARFTEAVEAARRSLLMSVAGDDLTCWSRAAPDWTEAAVVLGALDRFGFASDAERILGGIPDRQSLDGYVAGRDGRLDAPGAVLHAVAGHWRITRDEEFADALVGPVAKAVHWIERRRTARRASRGASRDEGVGLLPEGSQPGFAATRSCVAYRDSLWSLRGLRDAAGMLSATGQPDVAADATRFADALEASVRSSFALATRRLGSDVLPVGPGGRLDGGVAANLVAARLGLLAPHDPELVATVEYVRERLLVGRAVFQMADRAGLSPMLTLDLATAELAAGDERMMDRVAWLLDVASPTWTWPEVVHPRSGGGSEGEGHHGATTASLLTFVRRLVLHEERDGLAMCPVWPGSWLGQGVEVHDAPTEHGLLSFALRWHGDRPALLWELDPHPGTTGVVRLSAPGLDAGWHSDELRGEALLAPIPPPSSGDA